MKKYVVGFLFTSGRGMVSLVRKQRPEWQKGKLNGAGGHIEGLENEFDAMSREFEEETGIKIKAERWKMFHIVKDNLVEVYFFYVICEKGERYELKKTTDEEVSYYKVSQLHYLNTIPNIKWLIPMCLDEQHIYSESQSNITKTQIAQDPS